MNVENHLMLDIETLGNKSFSIIVSIGAVAFNIETGEIKDMFYSVIDIDSSIKLGFRPTGDTIKWWLNQNEEARKKITQPGISLPDAIDQFDEFYKRNNIKYVWGNSARFDCGLLGDAYDRLGLNIPWQFRNEMCLRTLFNLYPEIRKANISLGVAHDPIADCQNQITVLNNIWKKLKVE